MKRILLYDLNPKKHAQTSLMIENPPKGYEFIIPEKKNKSFFLDCVANHSIIKSIYKNFLKFILPTNFLYKKINSPKISEDINLIFSPGHVLDINFPWVLEILDHPACLVGYDYNLFMKKKSKIEKKLLSPWCKKIIVVNEASLKLMKRYFCKNVLDKCVLVRAAISKQQIKKIDPKKNIQILFMGSLANPDDFYIKGGLEAIESFSKITKKFPNYKLIVRCCVPKKIKQQYSIFNNIKFLETKLDNSSWRKILQNTDITLQPGHIYPLMATLEPMSYGIPIIMLDTYGVRDYLTEKNAILIKPSNIITEYNSPQYPLNVRSKKFISQIKQLDKRVIEDLAIALKKLIANKSLREKMGKEGRKIALEKFSLQQKNNKLKKIFDGAI